MAKTGDKFVVEIEEELSTHTCYSDSKYLDGGLYRIKGFNSLVFNEYGLRKLEKYEESQFTQEDCDRARHEGYQEGLNDAWDAALKILAVKENCGLTRGELLEIFESNSISCIFANYTATEAIAKIKAYEEQKKAEKEEIKVWDEIYSEISDTKAVIVYIDSWGKWQCLCGSGIFIIDDDRKKYWVKTGRHFPQIAEVLEKLKNGE